MLNLTLNQIVKRLEFLALSHKQVKGCYYGDAIDEFLSLDNKSLSKDITYPACFIDISDSDISISNKENGRVFEIWFLDLVNTIDKSKSNELEVLSDMEQVGKDFIALINYSANKGEWEIEEQIPMKFFTEKGGDSTGGVFLTVNIKTPYLANRCQVPEVTDQPTENLLKTDQGTFLKLDNQTYLKIS